MAKTTGTPPGLCGRAPRRIELTLDSAWPVLTRTTASVTADTAARVRACRRVSDHCQPSCTRDPLPQIAQLCNLLGPVKQARRSLGALAKAPIR